MSSENQAPVRVLSAGLGNMGRSHALAYHRNPGLKSSGSSTAQRFRCQMNWRATSFIRPSMRR